MTGSNSFLWLYGDLCYIYIYIVIFSWCSFNKPFFPWLGLTSHGFFKNAFVVVGDNDKREKFENVTLGECGEIKIGMQVRFEEEAYNLL